jgi:CheY-like chemotaxis protein
MPRHASPAGSSSGSGARRARPGIFRIIPRYGERAATARSINAQSGSCKPGGHFMSRFLRRRNGLKFAAPTGTIRNAMYFAGAKDLLQYAVAAPLATHLIDTVIASGHVDGLTSGPKAREPGSRGSRRKPRASERCQEDLASVEGLITALRRARHQSDNASRASRCLLLGAQRDLREPLTAMLRLHSDWDGRGTDMVATRMIEQQRQALNVVADLIDGFLAIPEPGMARWPRALTNLTSRPAGGERREPSASSASRAEEPSAERSMISGMDRPERTAALRPASRARRVLLIDEDREVLGALRIYLLCAGYRVTAAANADEALDRARRARTATSFIDLIIANLDLGGDDDGLAVIGKTRLLLGYNVPAVLLTTRTSIEIGKPAPLADVSLLRKPVNVYELNALIGEVLKRTRPSRSIENPGCGARSRRPSTSSSD